VAKTSKITRCAILDVIAIYSSVFSGTFTSKEILQIDDNGDPGDVKAITVDPLSTAISDISITSLVRPV
jgi:hypothetical protein